MENERFDAVLRTLASGTTRRGALGLVAGVAGFGVSGLAWLGDAGAKK